MRRVLLGGVALALLLALAVGLWFVRSLDARVERYLERVGSELLGSEVRVASVDLELRAGRATVHGLEVANPRGDFSREPALRFDAIAVTIDPASLAGSPIVLSEVSVGAPFVNVEVTEGGVNALTLSRHLDGASSAAADDAAGEAAPRRFRIGVLRIREGTLRVDGSAVGREVRELSLGDFTRRGVGGAAGGTPGELGRQLLAPFLHTVLAKVATDRVGELLDEQLDEAKEKLSDSLRSVLGLDKKKE